MNYKIKYLFSLLLTQLSVLLSFSFLPFSNSIFYFLPFSLYTYSAFSIHSSTFSSHFTLFSSASPTITISTILLLFPFSQFIPHHFPPIPLPCPPFFHASSLPFLSSPVNLLSTRQHLPSQYLHNLFRISPSPAYSLSSRSFTLAFT